VHTLTKVHSCNDCAVTTTDPLVAALLAASRAMVALATRSMTAAGIDVTLPQYRMLVILASNGPQRGATLAKELGVAPSTLTRMCDRLVRKSLVVRFHREHDRRSIWLSLTPVGRDLVGEVMRARRAELDQIVRSAGLTASEPALVLLHAFVRATGELPDQEWWQRLEVAAGRP
jgi:DNA-binding MarR family transcriptional regulator